MSNDLKYNVIEYNSIDISFSKKQKTGIKKALRKQVIKRRTNLKRNGLIAVAASALIVTFNNGNKAEIYKVERENGKLRVFVKGDDKKQLFDLASNLRTNTGDLCKCIEETTDGWIAEFDDITSDKVTIEMVNGALEWTGDYSVDESELLLK